MQTPSTRTLFGALMLALSAGAMAQTATATAASGAARIDQRQANQEQRIQQGKADGSLTHHEKRKLVRGQRRISAAEDRAAADGKLSAAEQAKIEARQDHQSKVIHRVKNDTDKPQAQPAK
ncbi:hypothetical protein [Ideonella alba]|uniref:DUF4148 domain-containing protein n=1 Tax=Ideonella alba TaxID=2824118 RepID=A0A940Y7E3_9BURK|nr:hypothetical protein [Ideonella alba]MBQ0930163.1 hypothetical protein [Ideonella alba]